MERRTVTLAELSRMSEAELEAKIGELMASAAAGPTPAELAAVDAELRALEALVGLDARQARRALDEGTLRETYDVCRLLMLDDLRERLGRVAARAG